MPAGVRSGHTAARMQFIRDILAARQNAGRPAVSYEFFTPKTPEGDRALIERTVPELMKVRPDFCSVTYGAGGSTRDKTLSLVNALQTRHGVTGMAHLTCVGSTREELAAIVTQIRDLGIRNILALRGDPPAGAVEFARTPGGFSFARDLVSFARCLGEFSLGVAGFPEGHIACKEGKHADWRWLKEKVDAGADFIVTQIFFRNEDFFEFRDYLTGTLGVRVPILPGILPVLSANQVKKFTQLCGATMPENFLARLEQLGDNDEAVTQFGIDYAVQQCQELLKAGVPGLHFYTLNKSRSTLGVLAGLGIA